MTLWSLPKRVVEAVADVTLGTAIVLVHVTLAQRNRLPAKPYGARTDDNLTLAAGTDR